MKTTLVIMAAGLGSRYGGNKQTDGVGPNGEILMEYGVYDAVRAGFDKIVFIIKPDMLELMKRLCGDMASRLRTPEGQPVEVCYAFQDFSSVPAFYRIPEGRTKPFGGSRRGGRYVYGHERLRRHKRGACSLLPPHSDGTSSG